MPAFDRSFANFGSSRIGNVNQDFEAQLQALIAQAQAASQSRTAQNEASVPGRSPSFLEGLGAGAITGTQIGLLTKEDNPKKKVLEEDPENLLLGESPTGLGFSDFLRKLFGG